MKAIAFPRKSKSHQKFSVNFDEAWRWIGYSIKQKAYNKLTTNSEEVDYTLLQMVKRVEGNRGGGSVHFGSIMLTIDAFKSLAMMAGTERGKEVRRYFFECERIAKKTVEVISAQTQNIERTKLELQLIQARQRASRHWLCHPAFDQCAKISHGLEAKHPHLLWWSIKNVSSMLPLKRRLAVPKDVL